ncbi:hypothetical protein CB1_000726092 [Camelus ferus]|nr:hypothetical protein CB1_000726092 [Camelus ferus]
MSAKAIEDGEVAAADAVLPEFGSDVVAVGAVPVVLGAVGFTGAGIAASSLAAKMMSAAAIANGGGVAAGSLVATLQSVGLVFVHFGAMEFSQAFILASNVASKILSAGSLATVGGAASSGILAGLPSVGLPVSANAALAGATSALGSLMATLNGSYLLGVPAAALASPLGALAVGAVPVALGAMGFTGAGITASSLAAKMMSVAAITNGGGVASGSLVATLQSVEGGSSQLCFTTRVMPSQQLPAAALPQQRSWGFGEPEEVQVQLDSPCHPKSSWALLGLPFCPS